MSGALVNLVSKGVQDAFLSGSPQVSFFRQNYKRHTNFAMKPVEVTGIGSNGPNAQLSFKIEPKGDLLTYVWLDVDDIGKGADTDQDIQTGVSNTPTEIELWIGGKMVDRQDAFFIDSLWSKFLASSPSKYWRPTSSTQGATGNAFLPLHFFHCDETTTPLPLVAMQYQEVEIRIKQGANIKAASSAKLKMYANMIMLDTDERKFFTDNEHEILITQTQRIAVDGAAASTSSVDLSYFNHPVKAIVFGGDADDGLDVTDVQMVVNGNDYFGTPMPRKYFNNVVNYYHTENTLQNGDANDSAKYMVPLSLCPCKHQPTGTLNFSRVDNAKLTWTKDGTEPLPFVYGVNYNVLRVKGGMSGVAFSN